MEIVGKGRRDGRRGGVNGVGAGSRGRRRREGGGGEGRGRVVWKRGRGGMMEEEMWRVGQKEGGV